MRWRTRRPEDFDAEIQAHLAIEADRLVSEGMTHEEAAAAARKAFGNVTRTRERYYESRRLLWLDQLRQDLRAGARNLARYPLAASVAVLSIAAGIGATTAFLTLRNFVFENPPALYRAPERLSYVQAGPRDRPIYPAGSAVPGDLFAEWRRVDGVALTGASSRGVHDVRTDDRVEPVPVRAVAPDFFAVLGVGPQIGRAFSSSRENVAEAVLSYRRWQQWFDGSADALGRTIWIDGTAHTVIGVMPPGFWFSEMDSPVWTRLDVGSLTARDEVQVVVRRPDGMTHDALAGVLDHSLPEYARSRSRTPLQLRVSEVKGTPMGNQMAAILPYMFAVSVLLTLLIACANVAILMIAQWTTREAETAVRTALGATRWRIVRALVAESVVIAAIAGALGVAATFAIRGIIVGRSTADETFLNLSIDPAIFWQVALITVMTGIAAGIGPALFETRRMQIDPLRGIATSDRIRQRWSQALVVLEITVTLALLVVTTSMLDAYRRGQNANLGFDADAFVVARISSGAGVQATGVLDTLGSVPGVGAAAAATAAPFAGRGPRLPVSAGPEDSGVRAERVAISPGFFSTLAIPTHAGRTFGSADSPDGRTAVVNDTLAVQLYAASPVGRQIWIDGTPHDVIGVVGDYASAPIEQRLSTPKVFLPLPAAEPATNLRFLVRASGDPAMLVEPVRRILRVAAPGANVSAYTIRQMLTISSQEMLMGTAPFFPLIVIGMLLTSSGIYGVLAFAIARRSRELAVRVAVGASRRDQVRLVAAHSGRLLAMGLGCGIGLTFGLSRLVRASGGAGSLYDPPLPAFVIPVGVVLAVALLATWVPLRRVLRINPALLLRTN